MPTQDPYHDLVKNALRKDGWRITHNALQLKRSAATTAGESWTPPLLAADKDERKIAVATNSFIGRSDLADITLAWEQLAVFRPRLRAMESDRVFYLAVRQATYNACFAEPEGRLLLGRQHMQLIVFDPRTEEIVQWVPGLSVLRPATA